MTHHTGVTFQVNVPDFQKRIEFYSLVLKRRPDFIPHENFAEWEIVPQAWLQVGLGKPEHGRPIRFGVKHIHQEIQRLSQDGNIEASKVVDVNNSGDIALWCDFHDPWGNRLGLFQDLSH